MQSYFIFNNTNSLDMGIVVNKLPQIIKSEKNVEKIEVLGRDGFLTKDYKTYKSTVKSVECTLMDGNIDKICAWLDGSDEVIFSNESDKIYKATIINQIPFEKIIPLAYRFIVQFECQPLKHLKDENEINWEVETTSNSVLGNIVSTNATCDGMMNIEIGGNTLKNEIQNGDFSNGTTGWMGNLSSISVENNVLTASPNDAGARGVYTMINGTAQHKYYVSCNIYTDYADSIEIGIEGARVSCADVPTNIWKRYSVISSFNNSNAVTFYQRILNWSSEKKIKFKEMLCIDLTAMFGTGNEPTKEWCDANIKWFDGIKSVGEVEGNKIEALSCGKNLANFNDWYIGYGTGIKNTDSYTLDNNSHLRIKKNVVIGKTYTISSNNNNFILRLRDNNQILLPEVTGRSYTATQNIITFEIFNKTGITQTYGDLQIEEGTTATPYEPHKSDKLDILNIVLRGFNNVRDLASGDTITRKIGKMVLNGTESNWRYFGTNTTHAYMALDPWNGKSNSVLLCDKLPYLTYDEYMAKNKNGVYATASGLVFVYEKGGITTIEQLKQTLATLAPTVYYELATPFIEKLPQPLTLQSFKGGTLQVNTDIPPYIKEWHTINKKKINICNNGTLECKPIISVVGTGDIILHIEHNNSTKDILLKNIEDSITINTDIEECYKEYNGVLEGQNNKLYSDFPVFSVGESTITWEGNIQLIKIKKNECYL
ncbi:hypothetical protein [Clostridium sp. KNHs214]|uniref:hypothetical protein n=1 Tax=Clostridium sp. KNHs214 TaxID=1540257 RepID=UPI00068E02EE|nr:hypothetical protein [Clostridium sp. KNHs214]